VVAIVAIGWGTSILAAAFAPNLPLEFAALLFVGYGSIAFNSMAKTALQLASVPEMRGRVMSLWALAWQGTTPIGGPLVGWVGQALGARWSLIVGGLPTIAAGVFAYRALGRIDAHAATRAGALRKPESDETVNVAR
jgi:MFS family permease